jgi:hypothetical protein
MLPNGQVRESATDFQRDILPLTCTTGETNGQAGFGDWRERTGRRLSRATIIGQQLCRRRDRAPNIIQKRPRLTELGIADDFELCELIRQHPSRLAALAAGTRFTISHR